jgi:hypothetical protein
VGARTHAWASSQTQNRWRRSVGRDCQIATP